MQKQECTFCFKEIYSNEFLALGHVLIDIVCMFLFLGKMFSWMFWQSLFKLGKIKNYPCVCGHKAFWHLAMFDGEQLPMLQINWFFILFKYKLVRDDKDFLYECMRCTFMVSKPEVPHCYKYQPLDNLIYLESLYKKSK